MTPRSPLAPRSLGIHLLQGASLLLVLALLPATPLLAFVEPDTPPLAGTVRPPVWILEEAAEPGAADHSPPGAAVAAFRSRAGGSWKTPIDRRTGKALLFQGSGVPMVPGAGNHLKRSDVAAGILDEKGAPRLAGLEQLVRGFLHENRPLFVPDRGELVLNEDRSTVLEEGRVVFVDYDWLVDGVPVIGANVFARINSGNLIQAGTRLVGRIDTPTTPRLTAGEGLDRALALAGLGADGIEIVEPGRLLLLPVSDEPTRYRGPVGGGLGYRLIWETVFREAGKAETWTARVDAATGDVIEFFDANQYLGQVVGGINPRTVGDQEEIVPFAFASVLAHGNTISADANGRFPVPAEGDIWAGLDGKYFDTLCQGCTTPAQPAAARAYGTGVLSFGTGGTDATGNGSSTPADRNSFYHLNLVRLIAKKWLSKSWLNTLSFRSNVNINASCNAYYDGSSVNFYRSSSSCNNTGEIADVMEHEWGHGLDDHTRGGDGATGEATADATGIHMTHSPLIGPNFRRGGAPVRNVDKTTTSKGLLTVSNISGKCSSGGGPLGFEVHCEGEIYGQTTWDLATALVAKYGANTGWRESERTFFTSLPQAGTYLPNQALSIYDAYIAVDDDDGNVANGTPNGAEIYDAFSAHEIAGSPLPSTPHCARPDQPVLTATPGCDQIALSWPAVPGAASYRVQKHWSSVASPFYDVATVAAPGTSYTDTSVTPGLTYHYVVQAVNAAGCESSINTEILASTVARPSLDATALVVDDVSLGNHSGAIDPGETIDLAVTLTNQGAQAASGITATLSTGAPGVTVTGPTVSFPSLAPGASAAGASSFRISVAGSVACGAPIVLTLASSAGGVSCPMETNTIRLETGVRAPVRVDHNFEYTEGWVPDAGTSSAVTGGWTIGDPVATNYQPGDDVTANGTGCWYTATNSTGNDDVNDVDGGQATLISPVMDLTGLGSARVSYWRWFGQRDLGDDPTGDFFTIEASNNGGSTWTLLESLGDNVSAATWTQKEYSLESLLPLTSSMRFRVRVSDATKTGDGGDIIEGAFDDFKVTDMVCDYTPHCSTLPTFSGVASASSGSGCGDTNISWSAAASQCQNGSISYNVYRDPSPSFTPAPENRIASGVTGLTYHDTGLTTGTPYYYVVRASDFRSGEETNLVRRSTTPVDNVPPTFDGIVYSSTGHSCGETVISWWPAQDCSAPIRYLVYRSSDPLFTPSAATLVCTATMTAYIDAALQPEAPYTYLVKAVDGAGNEEGNGVRATINAMGTPDACSGCASPTPVGTIGLSKAGNGIRIDWSSDPVSEVRYVIYQVTGPTFSQPMRLGTTPDRSWTHSQALLLPGPIYYFVSAVNACGQESALDTEP